MTPNGPQNGPQMDPEIDPKMDPSWTCAADLSRRRPEAPNLIKQTKNHPGETCEARRTESAKLKTTNYVETAMYLKQFLKVPHTSNTVEMSSCN